MKGTILTATTLALFLLASRSTAKGPEATSKEGYLIDLACARERKDKEADLGERHTRKCMEMPVCYRSGFGLLTTQNELLRFDEGGNSKGRALLQRMDERGPLRVVVEGTVSNDVLAVKTIKVRKRN